MKTSWENKAARAVWYILSPWTWVLLVLGRQVLKVMLRLCSHATRESTDKCMHMKQLPACGNLRIPDAAAYSGTGVTCTSAFDDMQNLCVESGALSLNWHPLQTLNSWVVFWLHRSIMRSLRKRLAKAVIIDCLCTECLVLWTAPSPPWQWNRHPWAVVSLRERCESTWGSA